MTTRSRILTRMGFDVVAALSSGRVMDAIRIFLRGVRDEALRIEEERIWQEIERLAAEQKAKRNRPEDWH